jgi:methionine-rich copper-binding protein CopC
MTVYMGVAVMKGRVKLVGVFALCVLMLAAAGVASAHAFLKSADPGEDSSINAWPKEIRLTFTEPVELRFSIFKVYRLDAAPGTEQRRLNATAGALVSDVLQKRGDEAARADEGTSNTTRTTADVLVKLKPDLDPGAYVVMWRVLSIDTHTTQGFYVFVFTPNR